MCNNLMLPSLRMSISFSSFRFKIQWVAYPGVKMDFFPIYSFQWTLLENLSQFCLT